MAITRRKVLLGAAAIAVSGTISRPAGAQSHTTLKFGHALAPNHPFSAGVEAAATKVGEASDGRVKVQVFSGSVLGGDADMLSQLRAGAIDMYALSPMVLSTLVPLASISGMPFAFKDYSTVWEAMDGDLGKLVSEQVATSGLRVVGGIWDTGFRQFATNVKPILTPEDLAGFKIRVPPSPVWLSMMQAFDAAPAGISYAEVYSSLQSGVVDGFENNIVGINSGKFYEVVKYISMANYMWDGMIVLVNERSFSRLNDDDKAKLISIYGEECVAQRKTCAQLNVDLLQEIKDRGVDVQEPDREAFRAALQTSGFYSSWRDKYGEQAWNLLEKYAGKLT